MFFKTPMTLNFGDFKGMVLTVSSRETGLDEGTKFFKINGIL